MKKIVPLFLSIIILTGCSVEKVFQNPLADIQDDQKGVYWFDVNGMTCRDGSPTGIGYRVGSPKKVAIYINGGGACFNAETCSSNPKSFNQNDWTSLVMDRGNNGIFDVNNPLNPLKDFSFVFVPYCTGDVHSGTRTTGFALNDPDTQRYVGFYNFQKALNFIQPYFDRNKVEEVVLFGLSAGGYGVYVNCLEVAKRFPNAKITVINDSGPVFSDDLFPICLQLGFTGVFGLPAPPDILTCCGSPQIGISNIYPYTSKKYPDINYGFTSSYADNTTRFFLSFGQNFCTGIPGNQLPADLFRNSLIDLRENVLKPRSIWSTYYINGDTHTMLADNELFYNRNFSGMYLYEWVDKLMKGERMHISE